MPNWCANTLTIEGPVSTLANVMAIASDKDTDFSLERFIPTPNDLLNGEGWYGWRVLNWGTKWDWELTKRVERITDKGSKSSITLDGDSAWAPPVAAIKTIAKRYPDLTFSLEYEEPGMAFRGKLEVKGEEVLEEYDEHYSPDAEGED